MNKYAECRFFIEPHKGGHSALIQFWKKAGEKADGIVPDKEFFADGSTEKDTTEKLLLSVANHTPE